MKVRVLVGSTEHEFDACEVRISEPACSVDGINDESQLNLTITSEGLIADLWEVATQDTGSSESCTRTFSSTFAEFATLLQ